VDPVERAGGHLDLTEEVRSIRCPASTTGKPTRVLEQAVVRCRYQEVTMPALLAGWEHHGDVAPFGWVMMALLLIAVVAAFVALVSWMSGGRSARSASPVPDVRPGSREDEALAALRLRYARGEVGRDEFLQASRDLGAAVPPEPPPPAE
jgi:uncharacterized membrane protein